MYSGQDLPKFLVFPIFPLMIEKTTNIVQNSISLSVVAPVYDNCCTGVLFIFSV